jgi:hypothetical protein
MIYRGSKLDLDEFKNTAYVTQSVRVFQENPPDLAFNGIRLKKPHTQRKRQKAPDRSGASAISAPY